MGRINTDGVIKGGLVAGLIINISQTILNVPVIGTRMQAELAARNLPDVEGAAIGIFVTMCFVLGLLMVWLYAAVRPRLGPGPKTAVCVGLVVWTLIYLWGAVGNATMGFFSWNLAIIGMVWGLGESILAAVAGACYIPLHLSPDDRTQYTADFAFTQRFVPWATDVSGRLRARALRSLGDASGSLRQSH